MFTYAQLQAGVEADQLYFDVDGRMFNCTYAHWQAHSTFGVCETTCPFYLKDEAACGLPEAHLVKAFFSDAIRKHNPEYLL